MIAIDSTAGKGKRSLSIGAPAKHIESRYAVRFCLSLREWCSTGRELPGSSYAPRE